MMLRPFSVDCDIPQYYAFYFDFAGSDLKIEN